MEHVNLTNMYDHSFFTRILHTLSLEYIPPYSYFVPFITYTLHTFNFSNFLLSLNYITISYHPHTTCCQLCSQNRKLKHVSIYLFSELFIIHIKTSLLIETQTSATASI